MVMAFVSAERAVERAAAMGASEEDCTTLRQVLEWLLQPDPALRMGSHGEGAPGGLPQLDAYLQSCGW